MRDTTCAKNRLLSLYLYSTAKIRTLFRTRDTIFPSILPVSAKVAIFRNIVLLSMYYHSKNEHEIHTSGISARDDLGIPLHCNVCCLFNISKKIYLNELKSFKLAILCQTFYLKIRNCVSFGGTQQPSRSEFFEETAKRKRKLSKNCFGLDAVHLH